MDPPTASLRFYIFLFLAMFVFSNKIMARKKPSQNAKKTILMQLCSYLELFINAQSRPFYCKLIKTFITRTTFDQN